MRRIIRLVALVSLFFSGFALNAGASTSDQRQSLEKERQELRARLDGAREATGVEKPAKGLKTKLAQWFNWPNWNNWPNWGNWQNWGNWGNW